MSETDDPARRLVVSLALVAVGTVGAYRGAYEVLAQQARIARKVIPKPTDRAFDGDGLYRPGAEFPEPWRPGMDCDIHMMVFGDSLAAGLGADSAADMPGVLLARGLAEESGQNVRLSIKAIVGATSKGLPGQVEAMQIAQGRPDISVILIGGNDITARNAIGPSARRVGDAVAALREGGSEVVVGTCPDLGIIKPVPQPLRSVLATLSRRLAAAQAVQVRKAGGVPVSLVETLAPEFYKRGESLFSPDRFHPNSAGYELAAGLLLPSVCVALGVWDELPDDAEKAPEDAIDAGDAADAAEALAEAALEGAPEGEDTAGASAPGADVDAGEDSDDDDEASPTTTAPGDGVDADPADSGQVGDPADVTSDAASNSDADADADAASDSEQQPRYSVVARLSKRLTDFVRTHEDADGEDENTFLHNEDVDSDPENTGDAREAAATLRRRSRILRLARPVRDDPAPAN